MKLTKYFIALGLATAGMIQSVDAASSSENFMGLGERVDRVERVLELLLEKASPRTRETAIEMLKGGHTTVPAASVAAASSMPEPDMLPGASSSTNPLVTSFLENAERLNNRELMAALRQIEPLVQEFSKEKDLSPQNKDLLWLFAATQVSKLKENAVPITPVYASEILDAIFTVHSTHPEKKNEAKRTFLMERGGKIQINLMLFETVVQLAKVGHDQHMDFTLWRNFGTFLNTTGKYA